MMIGVLTALGVAIAVATLTAIVWSIVYPERGLWPPRQYTRLTPLLVWMPTFTLFGTMIAVGVLEWGTWSIPTTIRFGLGSLLIIFGNVGVWLEVSKFGIDQTGGAPGTLRTGGLYQYSRNPQYLADILIVTGWVLMSASPAALTIGLPSILVLLAAPLPEEIWLRDTYGKQYDEYFEQVRRFL
jgi:protein-S-isoprenylcysteine O-methyltransferase Ste14